MTKPEATKNGQEMNSRQNNRKSPTYKSRGPALQKHALRASQSNDPSGKSAERASAGIGSAATLPLQASRTSLTQKIGPNTSPSNEPEKLSVEDSGEAKLREAFATTDIFLILPLLLQAKASAYIGGPLTDLGDHKFVLAALGSIGPRDGLESLLAIQMLSTHSLAMHCFALAATKDQTDFGVDVNINRANRLMRTFAAQMEALKKHRSNGDQHCTVEHVHVHRGGQAVVGNVSPRNGGVRDVPRGEGSRRDGKQ